MTKEELRAEEDYYDSLGMRICVGCKHKHSGPDGCGKCKYNYVNLYEPDEAIQRIREYERGKHEHA